MNKELLLKDLLPLIRCHFDLYYKNNFISYIEYDSHDPLNYIVNTVLETYLNCRVSSIEHDDWGGNNERGEVEIYIYDAERE